MENNKMVLVQTGDSVLKGKEIEGLKEILNTDIVIYQSEINDLVETELDPGCHGDYMSDYNSALEFYLSGINRDSYIDCLQDALPEKNLNYEDNEELLLKIKDLVGEGIQDAFYIKEKKFEEVANKVRNILEDVYQSCELYNYGFDIVFDGEWYYLDYEGEFPIKDDETHEIFTTGLEKASFLVREAINKGLINDEMELNIWY